MAAPLATLAWRNIGRNRRRSILTLLAVAVASTVLVFFQSLHITSWDTSINTALGLFEGYLQVQVDGFRQREKLELSFPATPDQLAALRALPGVRGVSPRTLGFALLSSGTRSYAARVVGVDADNEPHVSTIPDLIREGRYFERNDALEIVLGRSLARNLQAQVGSEITILGQGRDGSVAAMVLPIVGIFESGALDIDRAIVEVPLATFQEVFSMEGEIHAVAVRGEHIDEVPTLARLTTQEIEKWSSVRPLRVLTWEELLAGLKQAAELDSAGGWLFFFSLILIVCLSMLNTFLMSVVERTREFGVMLALGTTPPRLIATVLLEGIFLTGLGLVIGIFAGSALVLYFGIQGFAVPGSDEIAKQWNLPAVLYPRLSVKGVTLGPALVLAGGLLAAVYPAIRAIRVDIIKALKQQ